jgi:hypothetical protein
VLNDIVENWKQSALEGFAAPGPESRVRSTIVLHLTKGLDLLKVVSRCFQGVETSEQVAATHRHTHKEL